MSKGQTAELPSTVSAKARRDFVVGLLLTAVVPILVVIYMSSNWVPTAQLSLMLSTVAVAGMTLVLGMIGVNLLWRYVWATVELRQYLQDLAMRDPALPMALGDEKTSPWLLKSAMNMVLSEYRKQVYATQAEKAIMERRLLSVAGNRSEKQ